MVVAVVNCGVTPLPVTMFGVTVPDQSSGEVVPPDLPVEKCVAVPEPPVPAGKLIVAAGDTVLAPVVAVAVAQPVVRETLTRA